MNGLKVKLLDELMDHLGDSQGGELKSMLDESHKPKEGVKVESVEIMGQKPAFDQKVDEALASNDKEKGDSLGSLIGFPGEPKPKNPLPKPMMTKPTAMNEGMVEDEMTDDELKELLKRHMG